MSSQENNKSIMSDYDFIQVNSNEPDYQGLFDGQLKQSECMISPSPHKAPPARRSVNKCSHFVLPSVLNLKIK
tara:strand:- start:1097 stop:1315 length:219 start_codon:yes stop_codon:yes gene_type:complete